MGRSSASTAGGNGLKRTLSASLLACVLSSTSTLAPVMGSRTVRRPFSSSASVGFCRGPCDRAIIAFFSSAPLL